MKRIVLVGLAASVPALAADRGSVPVIRRAPGGAPPAAASVEHKDSAAIKLRAPGSELKRPALQEHKGGPYGEIKPGGPYGEIKRGGPYGELKAPAGGEYKRPAELKQGAVGGDAVAPAELPPVQREGPVRY